MARSLGDISGEYQKTCRCGQMLRGPRQVARQIVACPGCGHRCFIFPRSPWSLSRVAGTPNAFLKLNQLFLIVVIGSVLAMGIVFLFVRPFLRHGSVLTAEGTNSDKSSLSLFESGQRELRDGNVHLALRDLNAALVRHQHNDGALSGSEQFLVESLRRQSDLLSRLLDVPLEEIVRQAMQQRSDEEWQAKFEDYRGRTVIFDDFLRREGHGRPALGSYVVRVNDTEPRVALDDLTLLRQIPLVPARRWLFGARLASCRREEGGVWVIRFEPDSTVLLTEEIAAASCCPSPLDEETHAVLKRQREWLQEK